MKPDLTTVSVWLATFIPLVSVIIAVRLDRWQRKRTTKPPQTEKLLRPPGFSLSVRLEKTFDSFVDSLLIATVLSAFSAASVVATVNLLGSHAPTTFIAGGIAVVLCFIAVCLWFTLRAFRWFKEAQRIRLGLRGEQAVAEALNETAEHGFRSFHDFPAEALWNIDHITVGTRGVFLIETKACSRNAIKTAQAAHEVVYDGKFLRFPRFTTAEPMEQAQRNAQWLAQYLRKKTGETVRVEPLVVLPGWFVRTAEKGNASVKVMNATFLVGFLQRQTVIIDPAQVRRIITALDEKCRDVEF